MLRINGTRMLGRIELVRRTRYSYDHITNRSKNVQKLVIVIVNLVSSLHILSYSRRTRDSNANNSGNSPRRNKLYDYKIF